MICTDQGVCFLQAELMHVARCNSISPNNMDVIEGTCLFFTRKGRFFADTGTLYLAVLIVMYL
jgi:hypothetical protein